MLTSEHLDAINANDNVSRPSPPIPIKSPISDIANRPKQLLRLSRGKKRKSDATTNNSESKTKSRKTDSSAPAIVDKLISNDGKGISANKVLGTCVLLRDEINVDVKDSVQSCEKSENVSEKKSVCDVRKSNERGERRAVRYWQNKLHLTFQDKFNVINGSWLSCSCLFLAHNTDSNYNALITPYGSDHWTTAVLLPGFVINTIWWLFRSTLVELFKQLVLPIDLQSLGTTVCPNVWETTHIGV